MDADATDIRRSESSKVFRHAGGRPDTVAWTVSPRRSLLDGVRAVMPDGLGVVALSLCLVGLLALAGR